MLLVEPEKEQMLVDLLEDKHHVLMDVFLSNNNSKNNIRIIMRKHNKFIHHSLTTRLKTNSILLLKKVSSPKNLFLFLIFVLLSFNGWLINSNFINRNTYCIFLTFFILIWLGNSMLILDKVKHPLMLFLMSMALMLSSILTLLTKFLTHKLREIVEVKLQTSFQMKNFPLYMQTSFTSLNETD